MTLLMASQAIYFIPILNRQLALIGSICIALLHTAMVAQEPRRQGRLLRCPNQLLLRCPYQCQNVIGRQCQTSSRTPAQEQAVQAQEQAVQAQVPAQGQAVPVQAVQAQEQPLQCGTE